MRPCSELFWQLSQNCPEICLRLLVIGVNGLPALRQHLHSGFDGLYRLVLPTEPCDQVFSSALSSRIPGIFNARFIIAHPGRFVKGEKSIFPGIAEFSGKTVFQKKRLPQDPEKTGLPPELTVNFREPRIDCFPQRTEKPSPLPENIPSPDRKPPPSAKRTAA